MEHKKGNQEKCASAADQKTYFLSERTFKYEFKLSNLRNSKINALAKTCISWLSFHRPVMFLVFCFVFFFQACLTRVFIIYDQVEDKLDRCTILRPRSSQQLFFLLEATSGCMALFPLEMQRLWTWLAAQFVCSCRTASQVVSGISCCWATSDFVLPQPPPSFYTKQTPKELGQDSGWCQPSGPMPSVDIESEAQWCRDQRSVPCEGLEKSIITSVRQEPGRKMSFCSQGRGNEKSFWSMGTFLSVTPEDKEWREEPIKILKRERRPTVPKGSRNTFELEGFRSDNFLKIMFSFSKWYIVAEETIEKESKKYTPRENPISIIQTQPIWDISFLFSLPVHRMRKGSP